MEVHRAKNHDPACVDMGIDGRSAELDGRGHD
jgi:hypothetical protein